MEGQSIVTDSQAKSQQPVSAKLPADDEIDLLDYLHVIWRYRWMILVLCIMAMSLTVVLPLRTPAVSIHRYDRASPGHPAKGIRWSFGDAQQFSAPPSDGYHRWRHCQDVW